MITLPKFRFLLPVLAIASALAAMGALGEGPVQARDASANGKPDSKTEGLAQPADKIAVSPAQPCSAKPVRVVYGGYGEYGCQK